MEGGDQVAIANLKMSILAIGSTKSEAERIKQLMFDTKQSKQSSYWPDSKDRLAKDSHGIIVYIKNEDAVAKIEPVLSNFEKHTIKVMYGHKSESLSYLETSGWKIFEDGKSDEVKSYLKETFEKEVESIKKIFENIDDNKSGTLDAFELTLVSK